MLANISYVIKISEQGQLLGDGKGRKGKVKDKREIIFLFQIEKVKDTN